MTNQPDNVVSIADSTSPLRPVLERRAHIKRRLDEIKEKRHALNTEERELISENHNLATAEEALKRLLERK